MPGFTGLSYNPWPAKVMDSITQLIKKDKKDVEHKDKEQTEDTTLKKK